MCTPAAWGQPPLLTNACGGSQNASRNNACGGQARQQQRRTISHSQQKAKRHRHRQDRAPDCPRPLPHRRPHAHEPPRTRQPRARQTRAIVKTPYEPENVSALCPCPPPSPHDFPTPVASPCGVFFLCRLSGVNAVEGPSGRRQSPRVSHPRAAARRLPPPAQGPSLPSPAQDDRALPDATTDTSGAGNNRRNSRPTTRRRAYHNDAAVTGQYPVTITPRRHRPMTPHARQRQRRDASARNSPRRWTARCTRSRSTRPGCSSRASGPPQRRVRRHGARQRVRVRRRHQARRSGSAASSTPAWRCTTVTTVPYTDLPGQCQQITPNWASPRRPCSTL